jgi:hypothetical protein
MGEKTVRFCTHVRVYNTAVDRSKVLSHYRAQYDLQQAGI